MSRFVNEFVCASHVKRLQNFVLLNCYKCGHGKCFNEVSLFDFPQILLIESQFNRTVNSTGNDFNELGINFCLTLAYVISTYLRCWSFKWQILSCLRYPASLVIPSPTTDLVGNKLFNLLYYNYLGLKINFVFTLRKIKRFPLKLFSVKFTPP